MSYRPKTEDQLRWDMVKATVNAVVGLEVAAYRNRRKDELLSQLWPEFQAALQGETVLELDPQQERWVRDALEASYEVQRIG